MTERKPKLTKKQRGFIRDYIATGNGTQAALKNYDIVSDEPEKVAGVIASENLKKPSIIDAIQKALPDDFLAEKHRELFDQKRVDYFVFPKSMDDEEITANVNAAGIDVITIREGEKGKMAFYSLPDAQAIKGGLEMAYKIKGAFADEDKPPTKSGNTYNFIFSTEVQEKVKAIEGEIKQILIKPHDKKD